MLKNKKGAIELSMTTIIIIVMGVTLLILGIAFVRNTFYILDKIQKDIFINVGEDITNLGEINEVLTLTQSSIELKQKKISGAAIIIKNFGEDMINIKAKISSLDKGINCYFADTNKQESESYNIGSGKQKNIIFFIKDIKGNLRTSSCSIEILGLPEGEDNSEQIIIKVVS